MKLRQSIEKRVYEFNDRIRKAKSERVALQLLRDKKRWLCRNDLFYLACLTGNDKIQKWESFYRPFCDGCDRDWETLFSMLCLSFILLHTF